MSAIGFITLILRPDRVQILLRPGPTLRAPLSPQGRRARRLEGKVSFREGRTYSAVLNSRFQDPGNSFPLSRSGNLFSGLKIRETLSRLNPGSDFKPHWKHI